MTEILVWPILILCVAAVVLLTVLAVKSGKGKNDDLSSQLHDISTFLDRMEKSIQNQFSNFRNEQSVKFSEFDKSQLLKLSEMGKSQQEQLSGISKSNVDAIFKMTETVDKKLEELKTAVDLKLKEIQSGNEAKLEKMRETVDEKLNKTLEERLGQSFKQVSERLELVHKGLGEMQSLANGVGDLKKVLTNVKTRGVLGEIQLENILKQIFAAEQYDKNVRTNPASNDVVEFAVKLPGKDDNGNMVYLPIDSKFPIETYYRLLEAYEKSDKAEIDREGRNIETEIKKSAKYIHDKYISPPETTDFGVLFLPVEGLFAEVVRRPGLFEILQRDFKIVVTGPTTLAVFLSSLQMGLRTLAIEKRSGEVWRILSAVKTEFNKFGDVLLKAQKKINDAGNDIQTLVGARSKTIIRQLENVHLNELPQNEINELLKLDAPDIDESADDTNNDAENNEKERNQI